MAGTSSDPIDLSIPTRGEVIDLATGDGERTDAGHRVESGQGVAGEVAGGCSEGARAYMARRREFLSRNIVKENH